MISLIQEQGNPFKYDIPVVDYQYDELGQLIFEKSAGSEQRTCTYDAGGNLLSEKFEVLSGNRVISTTTTNYAYGDSNWKDKLTSYKAITYDEIGNPLSYRNMTMTWQNGRQLATLQKGNTAVSYTYDANMNAYCRNNPVINVDPSGTCWIPVYSTCGAQIGQKWMVMGPVPGVPYYCYKCGKCDPSYSSDTGKTKNENEYIGTTSSNQNVYITSGSSSKNNNSNDIYVLDLRNSKDPYFEVQQSYLVTDAQTNPCLWSGIYIITLITI